MPADLVNLELLHGQIFCPSDRQQAIPELTILSSQRKPH
jgi:hypothetical protein